MGCLVCLICCLIAHEANQQTSNGFYSTVKGFFLGGHHTFCQNCHCLFVVVLVVQKKKKDKKRAYTRKVPFFFA